MFMILECFSVEPHTKGKMMKGCCRRKALKSMCIQVPRRIPQVMIWRPNERKAERDSGCKNTLYCIAIHPTKRQCWGRSARKTIPDCPNRCSVVGIGIRIMMMMMVLVVHGRRNECSKMRNR